MLSFAITFLGTLFGLCGLLLLGGLILGGSGDSTAYYLTDKTSRNDDPRDGR